MTDEPNSFDQTDLTFAQREGAAPLPQQLQLREISQELRAALWAIIYSQFQDAKRHRDYREAALGEPWHEVMLRWHVNHEHKMLDEFKDSWLHNVELAKTIIKGDYVRVLDFIEFVVRDRACKQNVREAVARVLENRRSAYRLLDRTIVPITSDEQAVAIEASLNAAASMKAAGPYAHLRAAAGELNSGNWAGAVRESAHAVEAAARAIEPEAKELKPALRKLHDRGLHPALSQGLEKLYAYSSDEQGVRHALVFGDESKVGEAEAMFMFGACASFVGFLAAKQS